VDNVKTRVVSQVLDDRHAEVNVIRVATIGADSRVAVVGGGATVAVYDIVAERVIAVHHRHDDSVITSLAVSPACGRIVSGDDKGRVFIADSGIVPAAGGGSASSGVGVGALAAGFRSLFKSPGTTSTGTAGPPREMPAAAVAIEGPSPIVQLQFAPAAGGDLVCLVSTTTKACLLTVAAAARGPALASPAAAPLISCVALGKKPRDGDFGAAFETASCAAFVAGTPLAGTGPTPLAAAAQRLAFVSRPAKRLWIVDVDSASVLSTVK
jgi:hypothetical protein